MTDNISVTGNMRLSTNYGRYASRLSATVKSV